MQYNRKTKISRLLCGASLLGVLLAGCVTTTPTPGATVSPPATTAVAAATDVTPLPTVNPTDSATATAVATSVATAIPSATAMPVVATATTTVDPSISIVYDGTEPYLDDRSDAYTLLSSFVNALNRHEYLRAYSYWEPDAEQLQPYDAFEAGYQETESVAITLGAPYSDAGAGNFYTSVPATLVAQTTGGEMQTFVGCYTMHLSSPGAQATPPFRPLAIRSATVQQVTADADTAMLMRTACSADVGAVTTISPTPPPDDISADRYLDDRSTPEALLRSFANSLNRHEYLRTYAYWAADAEQLGDFETFAQGYAETQSVALTLGEVSGDAGAGQRYYSVPVLLTAQTTAGATQSFVGCYTLHLANPAIQGTPPFQPLAIRSATVTEVASSAEGNVQLAAICTGA